MRLGKIISIEGPDSSGKETQTKMLYDRLNEEGFECEMMSFPRYDTPTGRIIGQCYLGRTDLGDGDAAWFGDPTKVDPKVASMLYAVDRFAALPKIERIVNSGKHLILDRWVESNKTHQASKEPDFEKRRKIIKFIDELEYGLLGLPRPDMSIFLNMPLSVSTKLGDKRGDSDGHEKNLEYLKIVNEFIETSPELWNFMRIDCISNGEIASLKLPEEIHEEIYKQVIERIISSR